jgi:hypothetical protein
MNGRKSGVVVNVRCVKQSCTGKRAAHQLYEDHTTPTTLHKLSQPPSHPDISMWHHSEPLISSLHFVVLNFAP